MAAPTIGRIVLYTLTDVEADAINKRRDDFKAFTKRHTRPLGPGYEGASGHQAHYGNSATAGQQYPAIVVRTYGGDAVNLKVLLDGNDTYWATSATPGDGAGHWVWPPRV